MSSFREKETQMTDRESLAAACKEMYDAVEVYEDLTPLKGWGKQDAHIIMRRGAVKGASYDTGFRLENGKFKAIAADHDMQALNLPDLAQVYSEKLTLKTAAVQGLAFIGKTRVQDPDNKGKWISKLQFRPAGSTSARF